MIARALDAGMPVCWVTGDEVYGGNPGLRTWLETRGMPYVLAVRCTEHLRPAAAVTPPATATAAAQAWPPASLLSAG
jgi:hypothetical protein